VEQTSTTTDLGPAEIELVIRGGRVFTPDGERSVDVGIAEGRIVALGPSVPPAPRELDASGLLVLPGGIDVHVHLTAVAGGPSWVDDFESGTRAAAAGGITTVGNMTFADEGRMLGEAIDATREDADARSLVDFMLHPVLTRPSDAVADVEKVAEFGCSTIKLFTVLGSFDSEQGAYLAAVRMAAMRGLVTMVHCEDAAIGEFLTAELVASGRISLEHYPETRPPYAEAVATARAIAMGRAAGTTVYVVHLSCREALEEVRAARRGGTKVFVETRPMYLHLTEEVFDSEDAGLYVANPPLRSDADRAALWDAVASAEIDTVGSDHAPWSRAGKLAPGATVADPRAGVAELDTLLAGLYSEGVATGRISLEAFVGITSSSAARIFGLYPRKGAIAIGSDADLVLLDPVETRTVLAAELHTRADYSIYEGRRLTGWPRTTISRGEVVYEEGRVVGRPGHGRFLARGYGATPIDG
jgi:dihydropyrimidinase